MAARAIVVTVLLASIATRSVPAQQARDTIPVPPAVRAAHLAGTRARTGAPGSKYWQLWPRYELHAELDPARATLRGQGTVSFVNTSPTPVTELVLRLDQNRFRSESGGTPQTRGIAILSLAVNGTAVDLAGPQVSGLHSTVARIRLATPLLPHASLTAAFEWEYEVPKAGAGDALRQGHSDHRTFQMAQWYPRLAMYDDLAGWDLAPHDGTHEFFNPFGSYLVSLRVPPGWLVGATGTLENPAEVLEARERELLRIAALVDTTLPIVPTGAARPRDVGSAAAWRLRADSVNDFAWGTSSDYGWTVTSRTIATKRLLIHAFATPARASELTEATRQAGDVIAGLSERIVPYAWPSHTLVDGPEGAMEYPGLTMSHGTAIPHELAHQWFPMLVGTDETRFDFLDEGFATLLAGIISGATPGGIGATSATSEPLLHSADLRTPRFVLGYGRGSRMLLALSKRVGEDRLLNAIKRYAADWRFKHPSPWDFMASMETSLGEPLDTFWLDWLFGTKAVGSGR